MKRNGVRSRFVVCVRKDADAVDLELRKIYRTLPDSKASSHGLMRVVDEAGEDYLYPAGWFAAIALPVRLVRALRLGRAAARAGRATRRIAGIARARG